MHYGKRKTKNRLLSEKMYMKRILAVYFAVHILLFSAFALCCGVDFARRGSEKIWHGTAENCIFMDDLNKWAAHAWQSLCNLYNNVKTLTQL